MHFLRNFKFHLSGFVSRGVTLAYIELHRTLPSKFCFSPYGKKCSLNMESWLSKNDPNSFSNPDQCLVNDIHLNLKVDFTKQILSGYADISFERIDPKASALLLDTQSLEIHNVRNRNTMKKMTYSVGKPIDHFGSKLEINLPKTVTKKYVVRIDYETSIKANALQWLEPKQTCGKKQPYMFSQSEPIGARSIWPCQDTPSVKASYSACITVPSELTVLMSALHDGEEESSEPNCKVYKFLQKIPIPSYLIAIVVGDLESRKIGPRSHVWSEREIVDKAAAEFSETETFIKAAEELTGIPYIWDIYDILVLPPSFALGGMENPCLTFVTPTLLAGDKSLVYVVAHEISHSWTGNLVTNSTFEHFWLNEGFTVFLERKILGRIHNEAFRQFSAISGWKELKYCVETELGVNHPFTKLVPDLSNEDPDDAFSCVPYEKGHTLLFYLEELLGGPEVFEGFLKAYINKFQKQSIVTDQWKSFLYEYFKDKEEVLNKVDWDVWLYGTGMPPVKPKYDSTLAETCNKLCKAWVEAGSNELANFSAGDIKDFVSLQVVEFLALLLEQAPLSEEKMKKVTDVYEFDKCENSEIRFRWIRLGLLAHWKPIIPHALKFVTKIGRMKFIRPIYKDLYNWDETREKAIANYKEHRDEMMFISAYSVAKDLQLEGKDKVTK